MPVYALHVPYNEIMRIPCAYLCIFKAWFKRSISDTAISRKIVGKSVRDNPRKVLSVVLNSQVFKEVWKNDTRGHGRMFASAKRKQQK